MEPRTTTARPASAGVLCLYLALLFYGFGVHLLESQLNYPMWRDMGRRMKNADFVANRQVFEWRIYPLLVVPLAARVPVTFALLWLRPPFVPRWVPPVALALQLVSWTSSALIQIPIQVTLTEHGFSDALFRRLIVTDLWLRVLPGVLEAAIGGLMFARVAKRMCDSPGSESR